MEKVKNPGDSVSTPLNIGCPRSIKGALKDSLSSPNWYDKYNLLLLFSSWPDKDARRCPARPAGTATSSPARHTSY